MAPFGKRNKDKEKIKISKETVKKAMKIFTYMKPYRTTYFIGLIFLILSSSVGLIFPLFIGELVDASSAKSTLDNINQIGINLFILFIGQSIFSYFRIVLFVNVTEKTLAALRRSIYSHLIKLPMSYFSSKRVGELNSRIATDVSLLQDTFTTTSAEFLRQIITLVGGIGVLLFVSAELALFMLGTLPLIIIFAVIFGKKLRALSKSAQDEVAASNTVVEETLQGIANVKAFANEWYEKARYDKKITEVSRIGIKAGRLRGAFASFIVFGVFGAIAAVIWYGVRMIHQGEIGIGDLTSFLMITLIVGVSVGSLADLYSQIQKAIGATEKLMEILDESPEDIDENAPYEKIEGNIRFDGVQFAYPSRKDITVLKSLSFEANAGEQVALVGTSGAGKSTIASLLMRFYDTVEGTVSYDNKDAKSYDLSNLRRQIAIVPQEVLLFGGSIKENIAYGKPEATEEEIKVAADKANALAFIEEFPEGFDTLVGDRGIQLSGGQRQRIAIARAILRDPSILILDEATSALDSESERLVQEALDALMKGRTSIVIAHRLSTIRKADKIMVLEKGEVIESGTHDELSRVDGSVYQKLSQLQFAGENGTIA